MSQKSIKESYRQSRIFLRLIPFLTKINSINRVNRRNDIITVEILLVKNISSVLFDEC